MLELQQFIGAESLIKSLLLDIDTDSLERARMNRILMGLFERTGRSVRALECAKIEFDIFVSLDGPEENDLANAYSDIGYSLCSAFSRTKHWTISTKQLTLRFHIQSLGVIVHSI